MEISLTPELNLFSSLDDNFKSLIISLGNFINSDEHAMKFREILGTIQQPNFLSPEEIEMIDERIARNLDWRNKHYRIIESWLDGEVITEPPTLSPTTMTQSPTTATPSPTNAPSSPPTTTESTTLGAGSKIASLTVVVSCAIVKRFF